MKNQNTIKKITQKLLFVTLFFFLLTGFAFGASTSPPDTKVKAKAPPTAIKVKKTPLRPQGIKLADPINTKPVLRSAAITHLRIGTAPMSASGIWFWEATIKNTGNVALEWQRVTVQGYKVSFPQTQNAWTLASGSFIGSPSLLPNQTRVIKMNWYRCCKTDQLKVELRDNVSNAVLDTKILTSLTHSPYRPLDVRVKAIEWNNTTKSWRATLKNFTNYTVKLEVSAVRVVPPNMTVGIPAGVSSITLGPNGEASSMWKASPGAHQYDILAVRTKFIMGANQCNESDNDCGFAILNKIYIPNSETFF